MKKGDYVRTRDGLILKITDLFLDVSRDIATDKGELIYNVLDIKKSSPNIIDLIEVGDFIGKTIVEEVKEFDDGARVIVMADGFDEYDENEYFLKAGIVTKEQFESMEYRIGE